MHVPSRSVAALVVGWMAWALPTGDAEVWAQSLFAKRLKWQPIASEAPGPLVGMTAIDLVGPFPDRAPLWDRVDPLLQRGLERAIDGLGLGAATAQMRLAVSLVDITDVAEPRVAALNGDHMMYAASLPKIAILLAAFERIAAGQLRLDEGNEFLLKAMIRVSSNRAASAMMQRVGVPFIADVLAAPRYRLYDESHNGGLWVGKEYAQDGLWQRDPLHNLSHGATPMQIARFYYLLETGQLVSPEHSRQMKRILGRPGINHKFVKGMRAIDPEAKLYRKSGSWANWHSDSAIVERGGRSYIAVALADDPRGKSWLEKLIGAFDEVIFATPRTQQVRSPALLPELALKR